MHSTGLPSYLRSPSTSAPTRRSSERFQLPTVFLLPSSVCVLSRQHNLPGFLSTDLSKSQHTVIAVVYRATSHAQLVSGFLLRTE